MCSDVINVRKTEAKCTSPCILYKDWRSLGRLHDNVATSHYLLQHRALPTGIFRAARLLRQATHAAEPLQVSASNNCN